MWTFKLKETLWSDGTPLTAHDFVYAFQRLQKPETAAQYASRDAIIRAADASIDVLQVKIAAVEDEVEAQLIAYESGVGGYAPIIDGEIAILKLRAEIEAETARKAAAIARLNALLVTQ